MKLYYVFSRNNKIGSKVIAYFSGLLIKDLKKVPSHTGILLQFDGINECFIAESVMEQGVRLIPYSIWLQKNELCYKIPCNQKKTLDEIFHILNSIWNKKYDTFGILYFVLCFMRYLFFNIPFPQQNKWQDPNKFYCCEAVEELIEYDKKAMVTPAKMCSDLLKRSLNG